MDLPTNILELAEQLLPAGTVVDDRYCIIRCLGYGGMSLVYLAHQIDIGAEVAIKVMRPCVRRNPDAEERFLNEARSAASVQHPHVVRMLDYGNLPSGEPYLVMEHLPGRSLAELLESDGPMPWSRVRKIGLQLAAALSEVHAQGVVHCDVKPANCMQQASAAGGDFVKLLDFGVAHTGDAQPDRLVAGTPSFMAPEQAERGIIDERTDVYGLGATLCALLTGHAPTDGTTTLETPVSMREIVLRWPRSRNPIDPRARAIIDRATAENPDDRYASMRELVAALRGVDETRERKTLVAAAAVSVAQWLVLLGGALQL